MSIALSFEKSILLFRVVSFNANLASAATLLLIRILTLIRSIRTLWSSIIYPTTSYTWTITVSIITKDANTCFASKLVCITIQLSCMSCLFRIRKVLFIYKDHQKNWILFFSTSELYLFLCKNQF